MDCFSGSTPVTPRPSTVPAGSVTPFAFCRRVAVPRGPRRWPCLAPSAGPVRNLPHHLPEALAAHSHVTDDGYQLDAWLGSSALHGWEIDSGSSTGVAARLGFYWSVHDSEQGDQVLSIPDEFPFAHDPSLWATLELLHP